MALALPKGNWVSFWAPLVVLQDTASAVCSQTDSLIAHFGLAASHPFLWSNTSMVTEQALQLSWMLSLFLSLQWEKHPYYNLTVKVLRARNIKGTDVCKYLLKALWKRVGSLVHTSSTENIVKGASYLHTLHCLYVSKKASPVKHYI